MIKSKYKLAALSCFVMSTLGMAESAVAQSPSSNTGLSNYKIDSSKNSQYSNSYKENEALPKVTAYLSNWTHYQQGYEPNLDELAKYDTVLLSFFGLCGTQVGDPSVAGGVEALRQSCAQYGLNKYELSTTDPYADLQKQFPGFGMAWGDFNWLDPNPNGMLGVMQRLHEQKGTRIGISVFGWSLSNIASDAVKPENRPVFLNSLIKFVEAYPFVGQLDIDWEYPGIAGASQNVFDPVNDARNYKDFIVELRQALNNINRSDVLIGIASGAPTDKIDAAELDELVKAGVDNIHLMTYDFFGQWDTTLNHHTNLYSADETKWSADKAIQYMINDLGIPSKNIQLGYANYSRNAIASGEVQPSPLKGSFTPNANTAGSFEAASSNINDILANYANVQPNKKLTGKNGYTLYTDKVANADFLYNEDNNLFLSFDTPRTVYAKSQYALKYDLGGVFNWMGDPDEGLMLNAAREGLGYEVKQQVFDMEDIISSCGVNIESDKECSDLTFDSEQGPDLTLSDQQAVFVTDGVYDLTADLSGAAENQIQSINWTVTKANGVDSSLVNINNSAALDTNFKVNVSEEPSANVEITFKLSVELKDGSTLSDTLEYLLKVSESVPEINDITYSDQYSYADIAAGKEFSFSVNAVDNADEQLDYHWDITSGNAEAVNGSDTQSKLLIDTSSLINKPVYDVTTQVMVTNKFGNTDSMSATTKVIGDADANNAPAASIKVNTDNPEQGTVIEVQSTSQDELVDELITDWTVTLDGQPVVVNDSKGVIASFTASQAGDYQVTLTVTDVFDVENTVLETITVAEVETTWDADSIYNTGDTVIYNGVTYTAKWWTQGDVPG
ncbi:glycosyl hydrolase family 18 protein, partial [Psychromonas aquimarina]|uniref:glycosyl hydrolase family 18 protein n=1 Tax=Psychromonas aquimarina TaxID=444919 RepID=UPI00048A85BB